jgi:hypothetical protein
LTPFRRRWVQRPEGVEDREIAEDLRSALEQIESVLGDLQARAKVVLRDG